jgi:hypothetical protein
MTTLAPPIIQDSPLTSTDSGIPNPVIEPAASSTTADLTLLGPQTIQPAASVSLSTAFDGIADCEKQDDDVVMGNPDFNRSELCLPQNDNDLPPWLTLTIKYLRRVSELNAWQNLVTEFITFEKSGPPAGVSPYRDLGIANPTLTKFFIFKETVYNIAPSPNSQLDEEQEEGFCSFSHPGQLWTIMDEVVERVATIMAGSG